MKLYKIGRDATCDIVIYSEKVSSVHAELTLLDNGDMLLEDKGSVNGTYVMNQQVPPYKQVNVKRGDIIRFADVELKWGQIPMPEDNSGYKKIYGIGSHSNNDIPVHGPTVSRFHATVKVGRDGKIYIFDHSKNGTTVGGAKIPSNTPYRIQRKDAVLCGGVPVDLSSLPWPKKTKKYIVSIVISILLLGGVGLGIWLLCSPREKTVGDIEMDDTELFARYNNSVVMLMGVYHYELSIGNRNLDDINKMLRRSLGKKYILPKKVLWDHVNKRPIDVSDVSEKEFVKDFAQNGTYTGSGFFISDDGQLVTSLQVVKPWMFCEARQSLQDYYTTQLARAVEIVNKELGATSWSAFVSQLNIEGKLDYIALVPQGQDFDTDNIIKCGVLAAADDKNKDIAIVQTTSMCLPTAKCTVINVKDSTDVSDKAIAVGEHVYMIGFPYGINDRGKNTVSDYDKKVVGQGGSIIQHASVFDFGYSSQSFGGISGSPIFNKYGMLIGVYHQIEGAVETQGYNYGVKAKYVKELLENPTVK